MVEKLEKSIFTGIFTLPSGREAQGELTLAGIETSLYIWAWNDGFVVDGWEEETRQSAEFIKGILSDMRKVSLINCEAGGPRSRIFGDDIIHNASFFPRYVVFGSQYISNAEETITKLHFVIEDEAALFYDPGAFGIIEPPHSLIEQVVRSRKDNWREVEIGERPYISYYTGKTQIFEADTGLGKIHASHNPTYSIADGQHGAKTENKVSINLQFNVAVVFEEAVDRTFRVLRFLELLMGRSQNLIEFLLCKESGRKQLDGLKVYGSLFPKYGRHENSRRPISTDILISAVENPGEFSFVLANWLKRDETWRDARDRLFSCFDKRLHYIDRITSAANMFDILPSDAVSPGVELEENVEYARDEARKIFRELPESPERDSVLNALGRVGKSSLKRKIRHRVQYVIDKIGSDVPQLSDVTDEAVNCRNYYVHGAPGRIDYDKETGVVAFLTYTLEFVFAVSDLVEAGWDVRDWRKRIKTGSHPFSFYIARYEANLKKLIYLLDKN